MRRVLKLSLAPVLAASLLSMGVAPSAADAGQQRDPSGRPQQGPQQRQAGEQADPNQARRPRIAPLSRRSAAGPCPYVKILYDAARYVELTGDRVAAANVAFTGEIEGLVSDCSYQGDEPIRVETRSRSSSAARWRRGTRPG